MFSTWLIYGPILLAKRDANSDSAFILHVAAGHSQGNQKSPLSFGPFVEALALSKEKERRIKFLFVIRVKAEVCEAISGLSWKK